MTEKTLKYALHLLDAELKYGGEGPYYWGAKMMLDIIISENDTLEKYVVINENGKHTIE